MATIAATDTEALTAGYTDTDVWTATDPGMYVAVVTYVPTSGTGTIVPTVNYGTGVGYIDYSGGSVAGGGYLQSDLGYTEQIGPWTDPTGDSKLTLNVTAIDGNTAVTWHVIKVAAIA